MRPCRIIPKFSLRTLVVFLLLVTSGVGLWLGRSPWLCVRVLTGHEDKVAHAMLSPDASTVASASADGTARLWDTASGECLHVLRGHEGRVGLTVFSRNGARLLTGGEDRNARIWNALTGESVHLLLGHEGWIVSGGFSDDGTRVVTASSLAAYVWDARTGERLFVLKRRGGRILIATYPPGDLRVFTLEDDGTCHDWDASSGKHLGSQKTKITSGPPRRDKPFSLDGVNALTLDASNVRVWRRRPDWWRGVFYLWELWLTVAFAALFVWSVWRDRKALRRSAAAVMAPGPDGAQP